METKIELYPCENCETVMSGKACQWPYGDDGGPHCENCANIAYAKGDLAYDEWKEDQALSAVETQMDTIIKGL